MKKEDKETHVKRGFHLIVTTRTVSRNVRSESSFSRALYEARRNFQTTPGLLKLCIEINGQRLYEYDALTRKELFMSKYSTYRENNPKMDRIPSMDQADKEIFAKARIPFYITAARDVDGQYGTSIVCDLVVDTDSTEYKKAVDVMELESAYVLWFKSTPQRRTQFTQLVQPDIEAHTRFVLVKDGKSYDLDVYEV